MIELIQFPWSPFCIVQRRILEYAGIRFKVVNIPNQDRSLVWKLTRQRYYGVPILREGRNVIFEVNEDSQVIAKYLDEKYDLGLFPEHRCDTQSILWRNIENEIEGATFRLNDIYWKENVPAGDQLQFLRFKERKFGRGCLDQWRKDQKLWLKQLEEKLLPYEMILTHQSFILEECPRFVDFDLLGMIENFLYSGHYQLPKNHQGIQRWHARMKSIKHSDFT
ncbi:MAG TPA: glutathione S-transferase N-terminal domain-containing protein [Verrucomicrobiae bacterium]|jgi:glutathione S-transferase